MGCRPSKVAVTEPPKSEYVHKLSTAVASNGEVKDVKETITTKETKSPEKVNNGSVPQVPQWKSPPSMEDFTVSTSGVKTEVTEVVDGAPNAPAATAENAPVVDARVPTEEPAAAPAAPEAATEEDSRRVALDVQLPPKDLVADKDIAATKIQALYRGNSTRKKLQRQDQEDIMSAPSEKKLPIADSTQKASGDDQKPEEEIDIDLTDPDVEKAALKIQGAFKGLKTKRKSNPSPAVTENPPGTS